MPIFWRDELSVGDDVIDDDHRNLINIINDYDRALETGSVDHIVGVFDRLKAYTQEHFDREENLQRAIHFDEVKSHKEKHEEMIRTLDDIHRSFLEKDRESVEKLKILLRDWLIQHIIKQDLKMIPYLKGGRG